MSEFRITGPGKYRTRRGEEAVVERRTDFRNPYPWIGYLGDDQESWMEGGFYYDQDDKSKFDLIARIDDEPVVEAADVDPLVKEIALAAVRAGAWTEHNRADDIAEFARALAAELRRKP